ncbi:hypothetical protein ABL78_3377 [Leptomonas seymouri]|uniref:Uncharacterized protein n=1 Tax=Leptomonas seymouri TaxID=5684 RepID=A0A0N1I4V7_LEPSE|nr:hypothetical protein ABL78_3377 [Leptomonas seymouri]|eukprot:KPI87534.1 hypothetical protein ABL78_3377 [Leptomonas seymouri]
MSAPENQGLVHADGAPPRAGRRTSWSAHRQITRHTSASAVSSDSVAAPHPVELQVETMSSVSTQIFLYTWYAVLIIAMVVESNVGLQWVSRNFCGDATVSAYHLEDWNSTACLSWEEYWVRPSYAPRRDGTDEVERGFGLVAHNGALQNGGHVGSDTYGQTAWPPARGSMRDESSTFAPHRGGNDEARSCESQPPSGLTILAGAGKPPEGKGTASSPSSQGKCVMMPTTSSSTSPPPRPTMPPLERVFKLRWTADALSGIMDRELNRFLHVFISLASPLAQAPAPSARRDNQEGATDPPPSWKSYEVSVALEEVSIALSDMSDRYAVGSGVRKESALDLTSASITSSSSSSASSSSERNGTKDVYTYKTSVTCWSKALRCSNIVLPANVVIPSNHSRLTVTLIDVEAELAEATVRAAAAIGCVDGSFIEGTRCAARSALTSSSSPTTGVGVMYQRARYTICTIAFRYLFLLITVVSTLRFLYRSRQAHRMQYEQKWTLALQLGLILYLNPLYWWCIYAGEEAQWGGKSIREWEGVAAVIPGALSSDRTATPLALWRLALYYIEFHIPTYFVALTVCYIWGVIAGSFRWSSAATAALSQRAASAPKPAPPASPSAHASATLRDTSPDELPASVTVPLTVTLSGSKLARRRVHVLMALFMLAVAILDTVTLFVERDDSAGRWGEATCRTACCLNVQQATLVLIVGGILSSGVGLYWLRRNLARHPYLSTRPQQLACRIMIFIYFTGALYCAAQALLLVTLYAQLIAIIYYQPLVQLSHLLVLTSFVNHMTYVYTTTQSSLQIPLRPSDPRWKTVGWSSRWYRWLAWHGGSLYLFFNEAEEVRFYEVQVGYQLEKRERKEQRKRREEANKTNEVAQHQQCQDQLLPPRRDATLGSSSEHAWKAGVPEPYQALQSRAYCPYHLREGRTEAAPGDSRPDCFSANTHQNAAAPPPPLPRLPAPFFVTSAITYSALSELEEADWLLQPEGALMERHRSLSTVTQPSSNTTESDDFHYDDNDDEVDNGAVLSEDGTARRVQGNEIAGRRTPSWVPSGASPFLPGVTPGAVPDGASNSGLGAGYTNDENSTTASTKERLPSHRTLSRVSSRVLVALRNAESRLVDGTATFVDLLAEKCVDRPLQVLLRQRARQHFVFFNLETAIDCLNLSREAYAVQESRGDGLIDTGIRVSAGEMPRAALTLVERVVVALLGLCFKRSPLEPSAVAGTAVVDESVVGSEGVAVMGESDECAPLLSNEAASGSVDACAASPISDVASRGGRRGASRAGSAGNSSPWWLLFMARGAGAAANSPERSAETTDGFSTPTRLQLCCSPKPSAAPALAPTPLQTQPLINIEQYGYHSVAVLDTRGVQVLVAHMDVSGACPVHTGKHPRLTIAFRGTDNVANVLEDIRFRQRKWKEMETPTLLPRATVHSGFLELWMSLKEAVMDVVLKELRNQHAAPSEDDPEDGSVSESAAAAASSAIAGSGGNRILRSAVPFSTRWTAQATDSTQERGQSSFLRIYVTGHSLGGALACLCAYSLRRMLLLIEYPEPDVVVYTYGQPRIGNLIFKQHYNRAVPCTFRVVNESDVVSGFSILGGHHVGTQVNVDRHGNYICKPMYIERLLRPTRGRGLALLNHKLTAYANSLNAVADAYAGGACPVRCLESYIEPIESASSPGVEMIEGSETTPATRLPQREEVDEGERGRPVLCREAAGFSSLHR